MASKSFEVYGVKLRSSSSRAYILVAAPFVSRYDGRARPPMLIGYTDSRLNAETRCYVESRRLGRDVVAVRLADGRVAAANLPSAQVMASAADGTLAQLAREGLRLVPILKAERAAELRELMDARSHPSNQDGWKLTDEESAAEALAERSREAFEQKAR